jgi:minor histocompatibility antigen H13
MDIEWQSSGLILLISMITVYIGSYSTVSRPKHAVSPDPNHGDFDPSDNDNCKYNISSNSVIETNDMHQMTWAHTISIPVASGMSLYGLNYVIKTWSIDKLNFYLNVYVMAVCPIMIYTAVNYLLVAGGRRLRVDWSRFRLILVKDNSLPLGYIESNIDQEKIRNHFEDCIDIIKPTKVIESPKFNYVFDLKPVVCVPLTVFLSGLFCSYNPTFSDRNTNWIVSNMVAFCFTISGINQLQFGRFKLIFALLSALFFYDIYFVFATEIMVTVATGLNIPIKFIFPKSLDTPQEFILIGLGDLVIPGVFLSLCLRFDHYNYYIKTRASFHHLTTVPKPYFTTGLISYCSGLLLTSIALHISKSGQPALLYIVPLLFVGIGCQAWKRGEVEELWKFNDDLETKSKSHGNTSKIDDDEEDEDDDYEQECNDSYDEWEDRVELKRQQMEHDTDEDDEVVYQFLSSDDDDDTFVIGDDDDEEEDDNEEDDDDIVAIDEEINIHTLKQDLSQPVQEWYDDDS